MVAPNACPFDATTFLTTEGRSKKVKLPRTQFRVLFLTCQTKAKGRVLYAGMAEPIGATGGKCPPLTSVLFACNHAPRH